MEGNPVLAIKKKLASDEEILQYKKLKNQIRRLTRQAKKITEKHIAKEAKNNPKKFWAYGQRKLKTGTAIPDLVKTTNITSAESMLIKTTPINIQ